VGWRHFNGKSFGERTLKLKEDMVAAFARLHPDVADYDRWFARHDPVRRLRRQVDLGRLKRVLRGSNEIRVAMSQDCVNDGGVALVLNAENKNIAFASVLGESLPNIGSFLLRPQEVIDFAGEMAVDNPYERVGGYS
jgi:hypothetical protein